MSGSLGLSTSVSGQLQRELAYYRRECNDLGARLLRLQEEQSQAFREARRSRTVAKLLREAFRLADTGLGPSQLGGPMLEIIIDNAMCDRAAFLREDPVGSGRFAATHAIGLGTPISGETVIQSPPAFFFTTAQTRIEPPAYELAGILQLPYVLWSFDRPTGHALILGNRSEANVSRAFENGDQELIEGALSVYLDVVARTEAEVQTMRAMRAAEEANSIKAAFLATLSHELRTPLNSILGFSEIMSKAEGSRLSLGEFVDYAKQIHDSGHYLLRLINDILDYSRMARGGMPLHPEWVLLARLIEPAVQASMPHADERRVILRVATIERRLAAFVDAMRFRQILHNLVSNAIKSTPPDGVITVAATRQPDGSLALSVADTGVGMHADDIPRALEPFRQIDNIYSRSGTGTGLGLPITKGLVEAHDGTLVIESEPGRGTVVTVTLACDHVADAGDLPACAPGAAISAPPHQASPAAFATVSRDSGQSPGTDPNTRCS
ncbi:MAG: HAMP domain-containing histidine kinase [Pseudomonadota bacterium]|nr:HAMP domain-containing histidine kinase [Pseudomonadota bacterium]